MRLSDNANEHKNERKQNLRAIYSIAIKFIIYRELSATQ